MGNVTTVLTDRRLGTDAELIASHDYEPFGMELYDRGKTEGVAASKMYRFGFNGQEKDNEIGQGIYTAKYWEYDSRIGRRWNLDPKPTVGISDYACFLNNPIHITDVDGDSPKDNKKKPKGTNKKEEKVKEQKTRVQPKYTPPPEELKGFPGSERLPNQKGKRPAWRLPDGKLGEWDSENAEVEVYDKTGNNHKGAYEPETGKKKKDGKPERTASRAKLEAPTSSEIQLNLPTVKIPPPPEPKKTITVGGAIIILLIVILSPAGL